MQAAVITERTQELDEEARARYLMSLLNGRRKRRQLSPLLLQNPKLLTLYLQMATYVLGVDDKSKQKIISYLFTIPQIKSQLVNYVVEDAGVLEGNLLRHVSAKDKESTDIAKLAVELAMKNPIFAREVIVNVDPEELGRTLLRVNEDAKQQYLSDYSKLTVSVGRAISKFFRSIFSRLGFCKPVQVDPIWQAIVNEATPQVVESEDVQEQQVETDVEAGVEDYVDVDALDVSAVESDTSVDLNSSMAGEGGEEQVQQEAQAQQVEADMEADVEDHVDAIDVDVSAGQLDTSFVDPNSSIAGEGEVKVEVHESTTSISQSLDLVLSPITKPPTHDESFIKKIDNSPLGLSTPLTSAKKEPIPQDELDSLRVKLF